MKVLIPLFILIVFVMTGCEKSDTEPTQQESVTTAVKTGDWMVIYMENNTVVDVGSIFLKFNVAGTLTATKDGTAYNGTWTETGTPGSNTLSINIITSDVKLQKANKTWKVTSVTDFFINLKDSNASSNATVQLMKH